VPGGCGATVCLLLALLLADRSRSNRELALSAAPMALFNINEVLVFGLPVVLNPILLLPFVLAPVVALLIAYGAAVSGWLPLSDRAVVWTTPVFFSGYLVAGSWRGSLIQAVILAVGTGIYLPFVRLADNLRQRQASFMLRELTATFKENEKTGAENAYLNRGDNLGIIAKSVINQLLLDIEHQEIPVLYQPQINRLGVIVGAEALLRWKFAGEPVYPPLAVALAKEDGCYDRLTWRIMEEACEGARYFRDSLNRHFRVSVNITSEQLNDPVFIQQGIAMANRLGLNENLAFEVTEETNLRDFQFISQHIEVLRACGILMYIDDFSMGQTSLDYLQDNGFSYVKLDGGLVKQIAENPRSREIIGSIVTLGKNLDFQVVAEYVENEKIRDILLELGCHYFQGYLISPAATKERVKELYEEILPE
jgi:EAL domain-containing protein (putative c-di-GMP-specific phosphodiesterase class I)